MIGTYVMKEFNSKQFEIKLFLHEIVAKFRFLY